MNAELGCRKRIKRKFNNRAKVEKCGLVLGNGVYIEVLARQGTSLVPRRSGGL